MTFTTTKSCRVLSSMSLVCTLFKPVRTLESLPVGTTRRPMVPRSTRVLRVGMQLELTSFGVTVSSRVTFVASSRSTLRGPPLRPKTLGLLSRCPRVKTVSKGTANLVTIRTEDMVWNPPHNGMQLTKKLASGTKPPF